VIEAAGIGWLTATTLIFGEDHVDASIPDERDCVEAGPWGHQVNDAC
jgi:hypothetical protein